MSEESTGRTEQPTAVGLFCGAGGGDLGLEAAGYDVLAGADHDRTALRTYHRNLSANAVPADLRRIDLPALPIDPADVDHVHGSPPCQGFSNAAGEERDDTDPRNTLVWSFVEWCRHLQPRTVTMENVTGMLSISEDWMRRVTDAFGDAGYRVAYDVLNAADYGVAQTRRRVFVVGVREDHPTPGLGRWFPPATHSELGNSGTARWRTVREAIGDLAGELAATKTQGITSTSTWRGPDEPSGTLGAASTDYVAADGGTPLLTDQVNEAHQRAGRRPIRSVAEPATTLRAGTPPTIVPSQDHGHWRAGRRDADGVDEPSATVRSRPPYVCVPNHDPSGDAYEPDPDKRTAYEERMAEPATTVNASNPYLDQGRRNRDQDGNPVATSENERRIRRLTARECARLQSFPDWFRFVGTKTEQYRQVGNAVPPLLMQRIGQHIREVVHDA